ncbi:MAG: ABC transporter ATP-binding protein [Eggerthellaceae bacterium]|nr:ABC transporter ATP-binding protein [Eggerthellaceae bacterium]
MINLSNIDFRYRNTDATGTLQHARGVEDLSLHVAPGEFVVLTGSSGCGKTTVTRLINGLVPHYYEGELKGEVLVCGMDVHASKISDISAHVGSVFQNPRSQFFNVDTTSELAFASENRCVDPAQIRSDIHRVVEEMSLGPLMDRSIFALSGGEKQKVACASVAVAQPEIMVLDEPSSNLDAAGVEDLREVLAQWKAAGKTVLVAEHRLYYLIGLADRLLIMRDGRIVEELDASQLAGMGNDDAYARGLRAFCPVPMPCRTGDGSPLHDPGTRTQPPLQTLVCEDFDFHYKNSEHGIRFAVHEFPASQITAIVGHNGAGKSTFARVLCGLERKGRSTVRFGGRDYAPKERRGLCYMILQDVNHQLFTDSVLEEVALSAPSGMSEEEARIHARAVLDQLDLAELADMHPMALSGGQKQRVAIASGVVAESPVLVFDEPTSGLDLLHMRQVAALLRVLSDAGKVVIVITHDTELVCEVADRVVEFL